MEKALSRGVEKNCRVQVGGKAAALDEFHVCLKAGLHLALFASRRCPSSQEDDRLAS